MWARPGWPAKCCGAPRRRGERTKWIVGTESAHALPLGAFIGSLGEAMSDPLTNVRRVINSFVAQQRRGRVVVGVDDAHLLDGLSALVVHQLAQSGGARLVVTMRTGSEEPDAVTALWKDGLLARLDLEPLSAAATREVIESTLGGPVDARSAARFRKLTGGNALFLRQLLADQIAAGRMRKLAGVWMWDGDVAVSASLSDTVGRQMGRLSPRWRRWSTRCRSVSRWPLTCCAIWCAAATWRPPREWAW